VRPFLVWHFVHLCDECGVLYSLTQSNLRLQSELMRMRETQASEANDAAHDEAALSEAWQSIHEEKRLRLTAETDLASIKRGILVMGGQEVLDQILDSAGQYSRVREYPRPSWRARIAPWFPSSVCHGSVICVGIRVR
jgi:hypothetical protein